MLLRKHLTGAEILGVSLDGFERIVVLRVKCFSDFSETVRELPPRSWENIPTSFSWRTAQCSGR